ncbi:P-loop containing nucleoside triphosphate hydrolase protein, partial [Kalaharituber pfeilii]
PASLPLFVSTQLSLLSLERQVDSLASLTLLSSLPPQHLAKHHGLAILNLNISSQRTGLGGKLLLELSLDSAYGSIFPPHNIRTGDCVRIEEQPGGAAKKREKAVLKEAGVEGVVVGVGEARVTVAVKRRKHGAGLAASTGRLWVVKVPNDVTFVRMEKAMAMLLDLHDQGRLTRLHRVVLGQEAPEEYNPEKCEDLAFFDDDLNDSQKEAVRFAVGSEDIALIHGPPGTGKTQTLVEVIRQLVEGQGKRVLVCGPSNISVDNIILRLPPAMAAVRVGHPARLLPGVLGKSLDVLSRTVAEAEIVGDVRKELDGLLDKLMVRGKARIKGSRERKEAWSEVRALRGEFRQREERCVRGIVKGSKVVVATLHGASGGGGRWLRGERFDVLVVDEGSQAMEAQCWGALLHGCEAGGMGGVSKLIIAGDHMQLPPTPMTPEAVLPKPKAELRALSIPTTLSMPMFTRLIRMDGPGIKRLLTTQYRMHERIMEFPSMAMYDGKLIAADSVRRHLLRDLEGVEDTEETSEPVVWLDTQGGEFPEAVPEAGVGTSVLGSESKSNPGEVLLVVGHIRKLLRAGVKARDIGVITPYAAQVALIAAALRDAEGGGGDGGCGTDAMSEIEIGSVDGFQGREKEVVVVSLVRSNEEGEIGFLGEGRRMNVAVTRPRRALVVVGDGSTLGGGG